LEKENRLKACLVAGKEGQLGVLLYDKYDPCSSDVCSVMECTHVIRENHEAGFLSAFVRICDHDQDEKKKYGDLREEPVDVMAALARTRQAMRYIPKSQEPFINVRLVLPREATVRSDRLARMMVGILSWEWFAAEVYYTARSMNTPNMERALGLKVTVMEADFGQACTVASVVSHRLPVVDTH
jgi:hypothetical protein